MTKTELIKAMAEKAGISNKQAAAALDAAIEGIEAAVVAGDSVRFTGFGTFEAAERAAREGINPRTGEKMSVPACKTPVFRAGSSFKALVKGK